MQRSSRRLLFLVFGLMASIVISALIYQVGMARLEGRPRTFWQALAWAGESLSTTGYGADSRWFHPVMVVFVVLVQFVGVFLVFLIIPIYMIPFLEERFEEKVPRQARDDLNDHVVIYRFGPTVEMLVQRLAASGVPSLVVETDETAARAVMESGQAVVFSRSEEDALDLCRLSEARAIVANGRDEENAALVLRARQMGFPRAIYAFVEDPSHRKPMELAGATSAYTPRHIIAAALAAHASDTLSPRLPGIESIAGVERREVRVPPSSPLAGRTLREAALPVAVVGVWSRSRLQARRSPDSVIEPNIVLEMVGEPDALVQAATMLGAPLLRNRGPFLIAGFGEVGRKVHELLRDVDEEVRVIEKRPGSNVDVAGDVLDPSVLEQAGIREARSLILALDSDDATLFATVIARDLAEDVPVIARVNHGRNIDNIHRAGAHYALSISDVSSEMLSARLLGRQGRMREEHRRVERIDGATCAGRTVLAVERDGTIIRRLEPGFAINATDSVWVV